RPRVRIEQASARESRAGARAIVLRQRRFSPQRAEAREWGFVNHNQALSGPEPLGARDWISVIRPVGLFVFTMFAGALGGCAGTTAPRMAAAPQNTVQSPPAAADLDSLAYARPMARSATAAQAHMPGHVAVPVPTPVPVPLPAPVAVPPPVVPVPVIVPVVEAPAEAFAGEPPYILDTGDRLRVVVFGQDGLTNSYVVDASGAITMPLIKAVAARGLTTQQLARAIADPLRSGFVREPHVAIEVESYRPFFILGEVTTPGQYAYVPHMTVENAVAIAGGFTPRAYRWDIRIDRPVPGGVLRKSVPLLTRVWPGDTIIVTERWF